ncbi:hypothetical protein DSL72_007110 [Monilinia vaccinii-corymbosi]|uniref:Uncharacterized protein n=1 Tax=Monilinia vaccinii-corymbosi TaxID=61207 RepID=A0A8A3PKX5_9HELO|nr:hypothetical protein DSL72_007110 [Monilinia vaccinii-corymbosi]
MSAQSSPNEMSRPVLPPIPPKFINPNPTQETICEECFLMTHTIDGLYRLMTRGYLHHWLLWTNDDITKPQPLAHDVWAYNTEEKGAPLSPPPTPLGDHLPYQSNPPPLGYGCPICSTALSAPKASQKGSEILHNTVLYKYNQKAVGEAFRQINFHAITSNAAGQEIENPFKDQVLSKSRKHTILLHSTEVVEYLTKENIQITGLVVMRGDEEITKIPFIIPIEFIFRKNLHLKNVDARYK